MERAKQVALAAAAALCLQSCTLGRALVHNFPALDDHSVFASRAIARPDTSSPLRMLARVPGFLSELQVPGAGGTARLDQYLEDTRTVAFVVLHEHRLVLERYAKGRDARSLVNSFSIAKAVVGSLAGIALAEGRIASLEDRVERYRPELAGTPYGAATLRELLTMTSGVADGPALLPERARYYYGEDLLALAESAVARDAARGHWRYSDADVQVLGFVLERAAGMPLSEYLAARLWKPLGMESDALWSLDREGGTEKAFCCLRARARDFARFGLLYLQRGLWQGVQLVPASWAARAVLPGAVTPAGDVHRHLWWSPGDDEGDFYAYGHNGQYLYVHPRSRTVIVKFSETARQDPIPAFRAIARALESPENVAELDRLDARGTATARHNSSYAVASQVPPHSLPTERRTP